MFGTLVDVSRMGDRGPRLLLDKRVVTIGNEGCDVVVKSRGLVTAGNARVEVDQHGRVWLANLGGGPHGITFNGSPLKGRVVLGDRDVFAVGEQCFRFEMVAPITKDSVQSEAGEQLAIMNRKPFTPVPDPNEDTDPPLQNVTMRQKALADVRDQIFDMSDENVPLFTRLSSPLPASFWPTGGKFTSRSRDSPVFTEDRRSRSGTEPSSPLTVATRPHRLSFSGGAGHSALLVEDPCNSPSGNSLNPKECTRHIAHNFCHGRSWAQCPHVRALLEFLHRRKGEQTTRIRQSHNDDGEESLELRVSELEATLADLEMVLEEAVASELGMPYEGPHTESPDATHAGAMSSRSQEAEKEEEEEEEEAVENSVDEQENEQSTGVPEDPAREGQSEFVAIQAENERLKNSLDEKITDYEETKGQLLVVSRELLNQVRLRTAKENEAEVLRQKMEAVTEELLELNRKGKDSVVPSAEGRQCSDQDANPEDPGDESASDESDAEDDHMLEPSQPEGQHPPRTPDSYYPEDLGMRVIALGKRLCAIRRALVFSDKFDQICDLLHGEQQSREVFEAALEGLAREKRTNEFQNANRVRLTLERRGQGGGALESAREKCKLAAKKLKACLVDSDVLYEGRSKALDRSIKNLQGFLRLGLASLAKDPSQLASLLPEGDVGNPNEQVESYIRWQEVFTSVMGSLLLRTGRLVGELHQCLEEESINIVRILPVGGAAATGLYYAGLRMLEEMQRDKAHKFKDSDRTTDSLHHEVALACYEIESARQLDKNQSEIRAHLDRLRHLWRETRKKYNHMFAEVENARLDPLEFHVIRDMELRMTEVSAEATRLGQQITILEGQLQKPADLMMA